MAQDTLFRRARRAQFRMSGECCEYSIDHKSMSGRKQRPRNVCPAFNDPCNKLSRRWHTTADNFPHCLSRKKLLETREVSRRRQEGDEPRKRPHWARVHQQIKQAHTRTTCILSSSAPKSKLNIWTDWTNVCPRLYKYQMPNGSQVYRTYSIYITPGGGNSALFLTKKYKHKTFCCSPSVYLFVCSRGTTIKSRRNAMTHPEPFGGGRHYRQHSHSTVYIGYHVQPHGNAKTPRKEI